ncbi:MAG TPA: hypothetical protein VLH09_06555 [Bryobacteraceae bacterium]|nr:hypothetical protein [Bryobacteraceae bacterium]
MTGDELTRYLVSLPERVVRSATAMAAGLARELGDVAVPVSIRRTRTYQSMVDSTLRFLIEQVGRVEGVYPAEGRLAEDFAFRRAAGNGLELIGVLTFRASPVWVLAVLADLSGAGRRLVEEICESLKQEGLLDPSSNFETVDQMLDGLEKWMGRVAEAINTPPLEIGQLRREWADIQQQAAKLSPAILPSAESLWQRWADLKEAAAAQGRPVFQVSALLALSAMSRLPAGVLWLGRSVRLASLRAGRLLAESLLDHYTSTLQEIHQTGYMTYFAREMRPYLRAAAAQFSPGKASLTERLLGRLPRP